MPNTPIRAVLFDMGGTLEDLYYDEPIRLKATADLRGFLGSLGLDPGLSLPDLQTTILSGLRTYQDWRAASERELPPEEVWTSYVFTNQGADQACLRAAADEIAFFYETHFYVRGLRPEAAAALQALQQGGFRLAIISNVLSRRLVPYKLAEYGIAHHFGAVVTSASLGWRKPNERIFEEACRLIQVPPQACAYVGDTISRDVIGARRAGYGLAIQIKSFLTGKADRGTAAMPPDAVVQDLRQVLDLVSHPAGEMHGR